MESFSRFPAGLQKWFMNRIIINDVWAFLKTSNQCRFIGTGASKIQGTSKVYQVPLVALTVISYSLIAFHALKKYNVMYCWYSYLIKRISWHQMCRNYRRLSVWKFRVTNQIQLSKYGFFRSIITSFNFSSLVWLYLVPINSF